MRAGATAPGYEIVETATAFDPMARREDPPNHSYAHVVQRLGLITVSGVFLAVPMVATACGGSDDSATQTLPPMITTTTTTTIVTTTTEYVPIVYVVQPGDGLNRIAESFGVDVKELMLRNGIEDPNKLYAGQELVIPPPTTVVVVDSLPTTVAPVTT